MQQAWLPLTCMPCLRCSFSQQLMLARCCCVGCPFRKRFLPLWGWFPFAFRLRIASGILFGAAVFGALLRRTPRAWLSCALPEPPALNDSGPIKKKAHEAYMQVTTLVQDAYMLALALCLQAVAVVALLPCISSPVCAIKQVPGLQWTQGGSHVMLHNIPEEAIPEALFHLL